MTGMTLLFLWTVIFFSQPAMIKPQHTQVHTFLTAAPQTYEAVPWEPDGSVIRAHTGSGGMTNYEL